MRRFNIYIFICFSVAINAQVNLVPNPSFEDTVQCPESTGEIFYSLNWSSPTFGSPDYFNSCHTSNLAGTPNNFFGQQIPYHGNAYSGLVLYQPPNLREYIQIKLDSVLQPGASYCVSYYVSLAEVSGYSVKQIGAYISDSLINNTTTATLGLIPVTENNSYIIDSIFWVKVTGTFIANGGQYLIIGNFRDDINTDTLKVSNNSNACYTYIDSIELRRCPLSAVKETQQEVIRISPNPVSSYVNILLGQGMAPATITLYNSLGQEINHIATEIEGTILVNFDSAVSHIIFIRIETMGRVFNYKLLKQ